MKTHATDNVVDLLKESMDNLPDDLCQVLRLAACLGSTFDEKTLSLGEAHHFLLLGQGPSDNAGGDPMPGMDFKIWLE